MRIKPILQVVLLSALFAGYLSVAIADHHMKPADPNAAKAQQMIDDADKARKKAASVEGEWRDTGKIIKQAQAALKKGNTVEAMQLAAKAHNQGVLGYQQAISQTELSTPSYLK